LELLVSRFRSITQAAGLALSDEALRSIMIDMGRAGINTLHALSDNDTVLLGAVTSLAVMRSYPSIPIDETPQGGDWPALVLPLDPYDELLIQLGAKKRPDFLCFNISEQNGRFRLGISILESKWRKTRPNAAELHELLNRQCLTFKNDLQARVVADRSDERAAISSALLLAELVAAAIKLRGSTHPEDATFQGAQGARRATEIVRALLNGDHEPIKWGRSILVCVGPDSPTWFGPVSTDCYTATISARDATRLLLDPGAVVQWNTNEEPVAPAVASTELGWPATAPPLHPAEVPIPSRLPAPSDSAQPGSTAESGLSVHPEAAGLAPAAPPSALPVPNFVIKIGSLI